jgi:hypothetical protein
MFVDPQLYPKAAIWQGIMLIVVIVWAVWLNKRQPEVNTAVKSLVAIGFLGIALLIGLIVI